MKRFTSIITIIIISASISFAQKEQIESGYIYQFTKYVNWPDSYRSGNFIIGVLGGGAIVNHLNGLASSKKVLNQNIKIKTFPSAGSITKCNILFIPAAYSGQFMAAKGAIGSGSTLIITENPGMAQQGAAINFVQKGGKVLFEINQGAFSSHGLGISTQLVNLAIAKY